MKINQLLQKLQINQNKTNLKWFNKLGENFKRTSSGIKKAIFSKKINNDDLDYLEEAFLMSDLGVTFTDQLISELKKRKLKLET